MKTDYELSTYQKNILDYIQNNNGNLLVDAKAGSGKTSTLILISDLIKQQNKNCLFLAFNKSIVNELNEKVDSSHCLVKTVHSLGLSFLRSYFYRLYKTDYEIEVNTNKVREIVKEYYKDLCEETVNINNMDLPNDELKELHKNYINDLVNLCNFSRLYNVNYKQTGSLEWLINKCCWYIDKHREDVPNYQDIVIKTIDLIKYKFEHPEVVNGKTIYNIDYTDMIYFPVYYDMNVPYSLKNSLDYVMVDECIPENHYIETNKGKICFKTLKRKFDKGEHLLVKSFNEKTEQFEFKPIINIIDKGIRPVYEIATTGLNKIQATDNHPFLTQNGWKQLKDLVIGQDYLYLDKPNNQKTKYIPNSDQLQLIYGSALGDGSLTKVSNNDYEYRIRFTQGEHQSNYLMFKQHMLNCCKPYKINSGYKQNNIIYTTSSKVFLLPVKSKIEIIQNLDIRGLAILYMDDGSKSSKFDYYGVRISCNSFNNEEVNALIQKFAEYDITATNKPVYRNNKVYNEIHINTDNSKKFFKLIAPYMHKDCFYKNPLSTGLYDWDNNWKSYGGNVVKSIQYVGKMKVMDMEVQDNHNFCVSKCNQKGGSTIVVHNCQDLSVLQQYFVRKLDTGYNRFIFVR